MIMDFNRKADIKANIGIGIGELLKKFLSKIDFPVKGIQRIERTGSEKSDSYEILIDFDEVENYNQGSQISNVLKNGKFIFKTK